MFRSARTAPSCPLDLAQQLAPRYTIVLEPCGWGSAVHVVELDVHVFAPDDVQCLAKARRLAEAIVAGKSSLGKRVPIPLIDRRRTRWVAARVTAAEKLSIAQAARHAGAESLASFLRSRIFDAVAVSDSQGRGNQGIQPRPSTEG